MMGRTEERLRDATTALGNTLQPRDVPPLRLPETARPRPGRRPAAARPPAHRRWLIPLGTAASVAAILGMVVFVRSLPDGVRGNATASRHHSARSRHELPGSTQLTIWPGGGGGWAAWTETGSGSSDLVVSAVTASSPTSAWAFGSDNSGSNRRPVAWQLTGSTWSQVRFPGWRNEAIGAAASSSPADAWAFTSRNRAMHWNGSSWAVVPAFPARNITSAVDFSRSDVWLFSALYPDDGGAHSTWHYDGHAWTQVPAAYGLQAAAPVSARDIWAYGGAVIGHWNGAAWTKSSVAALLPRSTKYCGPTVTGLYAASATDAWALGWQGCQDVGGRAVLLHYAGGSWHRVSELGDVDPMAVLPDGSGGVWIQLNPDPQQAGHIAELRYAHGTLTSVPLPLLRQLNMWDAAVTPGHTAIFAVGVHARSSSSPGFVLRYEP
jgi:hypothetical protein